MTTYAATAKSGSGYGAAIGNVTNAVSAVWNLGTTQLATNDVLSGPYVPPGARIVDVALTAADCETTSTALVLAVGDSGDVDRLITGSTIARAGGVDRALVPATGCGYQYTTATQINVTATTGATTAGGTAGMVCLTVFYIVEELTS